MHVTNNVNDTPNVALDEEEMSSRTLPWTPYDVGRPTPAVILLVDHRTASRAAIDWGMRASRALTAELHVVVAIERDALATATMRALRDLASAHRFDVTLRRGGLRTVGILAARELSPSLIIVGAGVEAASVCSLVDHLGIPVLVSRAATPSGGVVAASDMERLGFPVLTIARDYARLLERPITFVHNASPPSPVSGLAESSYATTFTLEEDVAATKASRLEQLAGTARDGDAIVTRSPRTVEAILQLARERDADIVSVGHQHRSWLSCMMGSGVTERLIARCDRSVLVIPVGACA